MRGFSKGDAIKFPQGLKFLLPNNLHEPPVRPPGQFLCDFNVGGGRFSTALICACSLFRSLNFFLHAKFYCWPLGCLQTVSRREPDGRRICLAGDVVRTEREGSRTGSTVDADFLKLTWSPP